METEVVAVQETPSIETEVADDSIAAHEAQFGRNQPTAAVAEEVPVEAPKHRAKSQRAGASDYDDIAKYTKILRETEEGIDGFTIERNQGESDRVFNLRKRVEIAKLAKERRVAEPQVVARPAVVQPTAQPTISAPGAFTEPEPKIDDFSNEPDAYLALNRALSRWDRLKEAFEAQAEAAKQSNATAAQQAQAAQEAREKTLVDGYNTRVAAFTKQVPDFQTVIAKADMPIPPLLREALLTADNGPQLVYTLATQPQYGDEAFLLTDGKAVTEQAVASTQRWLSKLSVPVVSTGATAGAAKPITAPRPPTPVRTGPIASGDELPGDESSLAEHEKAFGPRRHRRH